MLILSRQIDQQVIITTPHGDEIVVMVTDIQGFDNPQVKLGFQCDRAVRVHRREVHEAIARNN